jgi:hypothetical protein
MQMISITVTIRGFVVCEGLAWRAVLRVFEARE